VQREAIPEEEEEIQMKSEVQRASSGAGFEVGGDFEQQLAASRGGGSSLPAEVRSFMEPRFGVDFSGVRIHTGGESAQLNRSVSAQAFTLGQDIYLGEGKDDLESAQGKQLLAHELTHVVQQGGSDDLHRQPAGSDERQDVSTAVSLPIQVHTASPEGIARAPTPYDPATRTTEQLWADCDPTVVDKDEKDVPGRVAAATAALKVVPGYQAGIVEALLSNNYGKTPRAFIGAATEDAFGLGGHIVTKALT
jgi:hypothetical protein